MKITKEKNEDFRKMLKNKIRSYNNEHSSYHKASRSDGYIKHIQIEERENDLFVAGLTARIYWSCMYIDDFYVEPEKRGNGLGQRILNTATGIAIEEACHFIVLETYGFQAKTFYEKSGFKVVGEIKDYPPGDSFYTLRKDLI